MNEIIQVKGQVTGQVKGATWPRMIAELSNLNQYLKVFSLASLTLLFLMTTLCLVTTRKPPIVLAFNESGAVLQPGALPKTEDDVRQAMGAYLAFRYRWTPKDVVTQLTAGEAFIGPSALKTYRAAMAGVARFSIEKQIAQRVFPDRIDIDVQSKTAQVSGDRITATQALRAATALRLLLKFECGARTRENPWGIYITEEKEAEAK